MRTRKLVSDVSLFAEACRRAGNIMDIGGRAVCRTHPGGSCSRDATTTSEARDGAGRDRAAVVLQERAAADWKRYYNGEDVRLLAGRAGEAAIPPSDAEAAATLARFGVSRPPGTAPLAEAATPWYRNQQREQTLHESRPAPAKVDAIHARLRKLDADPTAVPVPTGIHTIAERRESPRDEAGTAAARAVAVRKLQEARR